MDKKNIYALSLLVGCVLPVSAQRDSIAASFANQKMEVGANKDFTRAQSTAAITIIENKDVNQRSSKNISNSILGQGGNGLSSMSGTGTYFYSNPTFYIRGLQSLSTSSPLVLVDGIERDMNLVDASEVDHVSFLKDAAAVALYGNKAANGVIEITTKRGKYNSREIKVNYDHLFNYQINRPKFINAQTYASAMNEALGYEGAAPKYSADEIKAFGSGQYPDLYPNVNWVDETFRHHGVTNKIGAEVTGGGQKFRYYTNISLLSDKGFIKNNIDDNGNNTQDKFVRGNLRVNLDIDLTPTTLLKVNTLGMLSEMSEPGNAFNLWSTIYSLPSAAFPIKFQNGDWGGSTTWAGTNNPVANTAGAAYYKIHERSLYSDMTINQDLSSFWKGLSATARLGYDTYSTIYENHSKTFLYGYYAPTSWNDGVPTPGAYSQGGEKGTQSSDANTNAYSRRLHFDAGLNFERNITPLDYYYSSLRWTYEYENTTGLNTTVYRQNATWLNHYAYKNRYIGEIAMVVTGSSRLAPGHKWAFAPTLSAAWVVSNENWMKDIKWVNFLKLRASYGQVNTDYLPGDNVWTYYTQSYSSNGVTYPFNSGYDSAFGSTVLGQMATKNPSHEKAYKYNLGLDATLFEGLNVQMDAYYQRRSDIWCSGSGAYGSVIGFAAPYVNAGIVNSWGFEGSLDYTKQLGDVQLNIGGTFSLNKNKIKNQAEEPRAFQNLVTTGTPLNSIYGLVADGYLTQQDIDNMSLPQTDPNYVPKQSFSTIHPGDIKYVDVNGDGVIDANDQKKIGHAAWPELYYTVHLGAEWKGLGFDAMFQGIGRSSCMLNTPGYYWGLVSNRSLSQYVYDNRWTPENPNAEFPRLSSSSNANNYQNSTFWLRDRSFFKLRNVEVYYNFPKNLMAKTGFINAAKLYVRGIDLFTLDHLATVDAESFGALSPLTRSIVVGASVTF